MRCGQIPRMYACLPAWSRPRLSRSWARPARPPFRVARSPYPGNRRPATVACATAIVFTWAFAWAFAAGAASPDTAAGNGCDGGYPTVARAEYVFACMAANGQTSEALERCSCSIDVIASLMPYDRYVEAETVLRMRQIGGEKTALFRDTALAKDLVEDLRRAQAEGEVRCF